MNSDREVRFFYHFVGVLTQTLPTVHRHKLFPQCFRAKHFPTGKDVERNSIVNLGQYIASLGHTPEI